MVGSTLKRLAKRIARSIRGEKNAFADLHNSGVLEAHHVEALRMLLREHLAGYPFFSTVIPLREHSDLPGFSALKAEKLESPDIGRQVLAARTVRRGVGAFFPEGQAPAELLRAAEAMNVDVYADISALRECFRPFHEKGLVQAYSADRSPVDGRKWDDVKYVTFKRGLRLVPQAQNFLAKLDGKKTSNK